MKSSRLHLSHLLALPLVLLGLSLFAVKPALAIDCTGTRYFVDQDATGSNSAQDWVNASTSLQSALTAAASCPAITEIWVAEGLYKPGSVADDTFLIRSGLAVFGGFAGTENNRNQRNWEIHVTVLSGDVGGNDSVDANGVVTTTDNIVGPNAYHVVTMDGTTTPIVAATRLDGFVVTAGQAETDFTEKFGGGLYCDGQGNGNECSPTIANVTFIGNRAQEFGGAMANLGFTFGKSNPKLTNVMFIRNLAAGGGALYNGGGAGNSSPVLNQVTFSHNRALVSGGAMYNNGNNGISSPVLNQVTFIDNKITLGSGDGGAMVNDGETFGVSSPQLTDVTFSGNTATRHGGAMLNRCSTDGISSPVLNRVTFVGNSALQKGGAMFTDGGIGNTTCSPVLTNVVFFNNVAGAFPGGGGMYIEGLSDTILPVLTNVTFAGNLGAALVNDIFTIVATHTLPISNTVFFGNDIQIINSGSVEPAIRHSLVQFSGGSGGSWDGSLGIDSGGNLDLNPRFVDAANGNLRLRSDSPAIDTGDNSALPGSVTTDIDGAPRIFDGDADNTATVDMGAYEFTFFPIQVARTGSGGGSVSSAPAGITCGADCTETFNFGTTITLTATANGNSDFAGWSGACNGSGACKVTVNAVTQVTATFTLKQYTIAVSGDPGAGGTVGGGQTATHGDTVTVTAAANTGYTFANWAEGGSEASTDPTYSFTATGNRTLVANFSLNQYTLNLSASPVEGGVVSGGGAVSHGENVTATVTANTGYTFVNWTEDGSEVSTDPNYSFTATGERTLVANFMGVVYLPAVLNATE